MKIRCQRQTIKKVLDYVKKYWMLMFISIVLAIMIVILTLFIPILVGHAIDGIVYGKIDFEGILKQLALSVILVSITGVAQWVMNMINNKMTYNIIRDIRNEAFHKIQQLPLSYLDQHPQGDIVSRVIADVDQFADGLLMGFTQFFTGVMTIIGTLLFMFRMNGVITIIVVLVTPLSLFVANFIAKKTYHMFKKQSETRGEQTALVDEIISNEKIVKAYGQEEETLKAFDNINEKLQQYALQAIFFSSLTNPCTRFVNSIVYTGVALTGSLVVLRGGMTIGTLSCFLSYANQYTKPFNEISGVITELQNALACAARIFELIEEDIPVEQYKDLQELKQVKGHVKCQHLSFSYTPYKKLIEDFNIDIKPGEKVAIVGPTGCGKTTLINLLMRFYNMDEGKMIIDDYSVEAITKESLRLGYGMVLQETWLKSGTIRENIMMGRPGATESEMIEAAKACHAHSFIKRLSKGYDTVIGEEGGKLSQGQKQLLCITRVMLCQPPMLILDEATSSIDTRTELKIQSAFNKLMEGRTSFIVAHRLSTIQNADLILVMKAGRIIEQGKHEELLEHQGFYAQLYNSQFAL